MLFPEVQNIDSIGSNNSRVGGASHEKHPVLSVPSPPNKWRPHNNNILIVAICSCASDVKTSLLLRDLSLNY